jgi:hypothetical protein
LDGSPIIPFGIRINLPPVLAPFDLLVCKELMCCSSLLHLFAEELGAGSFWANDTFAGPLPNQVEHKGWACTRSLAHLQFDHSAYAQIHVTALQLYQPTVLDLFGSAVNRGWCLRLCYKMADLNGFGACTLRPSCNPVWLHNHTLSYRPLLLNPIGGVPALNQHYLETWLNMIKQCSHLNQTVLAGSITSLVYRHYAAHLDL